MDSKFLYICLVLVGLNFNGVTVMADSLSPLDFGAKCDASVSSINQVSGTNDLRALRATFAAAAVSGQPVVLPSGKVCRADRPGGIITSVAISNNYVTLSMINTLSAGDLVTPACLSAAPDLNGAPLVVLADGLSTTSFRAYFPHADLNQVNEPGGQTVHGRGTWNPIACPAGALAVGTSPAFEITTPGLSVSGGSGISNPILNSTLAGIGSGAFFQFNYDKTAIAVNSSSDGSGNITVPIQAMPIGLSFPEGESIYFTGSSNPNFNGVHTVIHSTVDQLVLSPVIGQASAPNQSAVGGLAHEPWSNFDADGTQGWTFAHMAIGDYNHAGMTDCAIDAFTCNYQAGTVGILDYRGGSGEISDLSINGNEYGVFMIQSDFTKFTNRFFSISEAAQIYIGPNSSPISGISGMDGFGNIQSIVIDGTYGISIYDSHFRNGNTTHAAIEVNNRQYDVSKDNIGGVQSGSINILNSMFEIPANGTCKQTPPAFLAIDPQDNGSVAGTTNVRLENPQFVDADLGSDCNVPYVVSIGNHNQGGPATNFQTTLAIVDPPEPGGVFKAWINNTGNGKPTIQMDSRNAAVAGIPLYLNNGSGLAIGQYAYDTETAPSGSCFLSAGWVTSNDGHLSHCDFVNGSYVWVIKDGSGPNPSPVPVPGTPTPAPTSTPAPANLELSASWTPQWSNLIGYWKFDEAAGSVSAADNSSGGSNSGTASNVQFGVAGTGKLGTAAQFNASSTSFVDVPFNAAQDLANAWTISAWVNPSVAPSDSAAILAAKYTGTSVQFLLGPIFSADGNWYAAYFHNTWHTTNGFVPAAHTWYYMTGVYQGGSSPSLSLYVNGSLLSKVTDGVEASLPNDGAGIRLGANWDPNPRTFYTGTMDEVALWNSALSPSDVATIYQHQLGNRKKGQREKK